MGGAGPPSLKVLNKISQHVVPCKDASNFHKPQLYKIHGLHVEEKKHLSLQSPGTIVRKSFLERPGRRTL